MSRPRRRDVAAAAARPAFRRNLPHTPSRGAMEDLLDGLGRHPDAGAALVIARSATPLAPAQLAAQRGGGAEQCAQREAVYRRCLTHYRQVVRPGDAAHDDVGAAAAHFVAACLAVLRGVRPPDTVLKRLEQQLVALVRQGAAWARSSETERQLCFEKLAVLTVLFAAVATNPQVPAVEVAQARHWAHVYLRELLGLNPDALTLDAGGLAVAPLRQAA